MPVRSHPMPSIRVCVRACVRRARARVCVCVTEREIETDRERERIEPRRVRGLALMRGHTFCSPHRQQTTEHITESYVGADDRAHQLSLRACLIRLSKTTPQRRASLKRISGVRTL